MKRNELLVRLIQKEDNNQIRDIITSVMTDFGCVGQGFSIEDPEVQDMYGAYYLPTGQYYVIVDKNDVVYGGAGIDRLEGGNEDVCELKKMYFLPSVRGLGLGNEILLKCLTTARELGYKTCYLETVERMESANALYSKVGFKKLINQEGCTGHSGCDTFYALEL